MCITFFHQLGGVKIDIDLLYPDETGQFVGCSTFYKPTKENPTGRYSFSYRSFEPERIMFCGDEFSCVPESFLVDSYGPDWHIPKVFTYGEGIEGGGYVNCKPALTD